MMGRQRGPRGQTRQAIFEYVRQRILDGSPPAVREIQAAFGFRAVQSVQEHLDALVADGRLLRDSGKARGYRLPEGLGGPAPSVLVPLLGQVQAGSLTEAIEAREGDVPVEIRRPGSTRQEDPDALFALRIRGDSMVGAGILDGDIVIVRRQAKARTGEIVVALVGDEATVKRLKLGPGSRIELRPENPAFTPIVIAPPEAVTLLGKVIEIRRYLDGH